MSEIYCMQEWVVVIILRDEPLNVELLTFNADHSILMNNLSCTLATPRIFMKTGFYKKAELFRIIGGNPFVDTFLDASKECIDIFSPKRRTETAHLVNYAA